MNVIVVLVAFSIFTLLFTCYCAIRNTKKPPNSRMTWRKESEHPQLHFVDQRQLDELGLSKQHPLLFHLQGFNADLWRAEDSSKHLDMTVEEFEKCLPWIPYGNRILISSTAGFDPVLLKRLKNLHTKRDLFLVGEEPNIGETPQRRKA